MIIQGKVNTAKIYTDNIDEESLKQIYNILNNPCFENTNIAIMPDVHMGKGTVVGFTMTFNSYINPSIIGVDIGCGIDAYKIGKISFNLEDFDVFIKNNIPSGSNVHNSIQSEYVKENNALITLIKKVAPKEEYRIMLSIGTLGGGNHFLELDKDSDGNIWLIIHSGSRNFGLHVCRYHQDKAKEVIRLKYKGAGAYHGMEFMSLEEGGDEYLGDMKIAQDFALENRTIMAKIIIEKFFNKKFNEYEKFSSIHNYINFNDNVIRKGAISAHKDEKVIIPLNMRDGCILATGKGNQEWNFSAPHGAGRLLKRREAKSILSIGDYKDTMKGIFSSCINKTTIDESPMAYKNSEEIIGLISDTVEINEIIKPVYNFKAGS